MIWIQLDQLAMSIPGPRNAFGLCGMVTCCHFPPVSAVPYHTHVPQYRATARPVVTICMYCVVSCYCSMGRIIFSTTVAYLLICPPARSLIRAAPVDLTPLVREVHRGVHGPRIPDMHRIYYPSMTRPCPMADIRGCRHFLHRVSIVVNSY